MSKTRFARHFRSALFVLLTCCIYGLCHPAAAQSQASGSETNTVARPSLGHRILFYIPNRVLDLADLVRLRARVGPGASLSIRSTDYVSFYGGSYRSVYAGLPGPRYPGKLRSPVGREDYKGLIFFGVDATDDTPYGPNYSPTEFEIGAHVLLVGADVGFDPVELGDLLAGLLMLDPRGDDL